MLIFNHQNEKKTQIIISNENSLSTVVVKGVLLTIMLILGIHAPLTLIAQLTGMTFNLYTTISLLLILLCIVYATRVFLEEYRSIQEHDYTNLILLVLLGLLGLVLALLIYRPNIDDYVYVPNAVYFLNNSDKPMDFLVHFFYHTPKEPFILSYSQATSTSYEYFQAVIAKILGVKYLDVYYILAPALMGFVIPLANYFLVSKFTKNTLGVIFVHFSAFF